MILNRVKYEPRFESKASPSRGLVSYQSLDWDSYSAI
jgi:hypothetical protein